MDKLNFLKSIFGSGKYFHNSSELMVGCIFCHHKNDKLSINTKSDDWKCWTCGKSGKSLFVLLKKIRASKSEIAEYINSHRAKGIYVSVEKDKQQYYPKLPAEYSPLCQDTSVIGKRFLNYLIKKRHISEEQILRNKLGVCYTGRYQDRIILPSFDSSGNLNFFTGRHIDDENYLPYLNDIDIPKGGGYRNSVIINELNLDFTKPMVIAEGWFDLFKSVDNTALLLGSEFSSKGLLIQTAVKNNTPIILALDPDAFIKKTLPLAKLLMRYGLDVFHADMLPFKDLGSMSREEGISRIENASIVSETFIFKNRLRSII